MTDSFRHLFSSAIAGSKRGDTTIRPRLRWVKPLTVAKDEVGPIISECKWLIERQDILHQQLVERAESLSTACRLTKHLLHLAESGEMSARELRKTLNSLMKDTETVARVSLKPPS